MHKIFAINILNDVALKCETKMNSLKTNYKTANILDLVSLNITEVLYELSRHQDDSSN
jgi:hypothetical protein